MEVLVQGLFFLDSIVYLFAKEMRKNQNHIFLKTGHFDEIFSDVAIEY